MTTSTPKWFAGRSAKHQVRAKLERASSGGEALSLLQNQIVTDQSPPLIVFLDLNMPGVNGHEFLESLRANDRLRKTTVFVLTTSDHARDIEKAYDQNVAGYFTKPSLNELLDVLNSYISGARLPKL